MKIQTLQEKAEEIVNLYISKYKLEPINIRVKNLQGAGRARYRTRFLSVPTWSYKQGGMEYFTAYTIHEVVHFIMHDIHNYKGNHGKKFREMEILLLKEHNIVPLEYKKAYYQRMEDVNGKLLWLDTKAKRIKERLKEYEIS